MRSSLTVTSVMCAETAACIVTVKREKKVLKITPHDHVTEGVIISIVKACDCEVMTHAQELSYCVAQ